MNNLPPRREPEIFAAGDNLWFVRFLPFYFPANGWQLTYVLTDLNGNEISTVNSVANGDAHEIKQAAFASGIEAGQYVFAGYAVNAGEGFRHQIYYDQFILTPNLAAGTADKPISTHAQRMIEKLECQLEYMTTHVLTMTEQNRTRFEMVTRPQLMQQLREYKEIRHNEIQNERARNGRLPQNVIQPFFMIG